MIDLLTVEVNLWVIFPSKTCFNNARPLGDDRLGRRGAYFNERTLGPLGAFPLFHTAYIVDHNGLACYYVVGHAGSSDSSR